MKYEILKIAVEKINELVGIECTIINEGIEGNEKFLDAIVGISHAEIKDVYFVEIKKKIVPNHIPRILEQIKSIEQLIIIAEYITPKAKELLRINNVPYVDTAGNMFLNNKSIYVLVQTDKTNRDKLKTNTKAFNKAGLKVVYQFLTNPEFINKPYRFIGDKANVTIATVGVVLKDLLKEKYLIQKNEKEYKFQNREKLFEEWVKGYNRNLKPKLRRKRYRWLNKNQKWREIKLPKETYWGGAIAAEKLTEYLIADKIEIYTGLKFEEVMKSLRILADEKGEITITELFWKTQEEMDLQIDPMLIYADLIDDGNTRYLETANLIYKEYVQNRLNGLPEKVSDLKCTRHDIL